MLTHLKPNVRAAILALRHVHFCEAQLEQGRAQLGTIVEVLTDEEMIQYMRASEGEKRKHREETANGKTGKTSRT